MLKQLTFLIIFLKKHYKRVVWLVINYDYSYVTVMLLGYLICQPLHPITSRAC